MVRSSISTPGRHKNILYAFPARLGRVYSLQSTLTQLGYLTRCYESSLYIERIL